MKKLALLMIMACVLTSPRAWATVSTFTYSPMPANLQDLDHSYYYSWGIQANIDASSIVGARLTINDINDWQIESNDRLYVHMFDEAPVLSTRISSNVTRGTDYEGGGDRFAGQGSLLFTYTDDNDYTQWQRINGWWRQVSYNPAEDLIYDFSMQDLSTLRMFLANGGFGFGFDPDCHYNNCGISFTIYTENTPTTPVVPEPATGALMLIGLGGMAGYRRLRSRFGNK
ncbi:PEP-CTERM sorting domain-containing protein [bacterium]|nr:PEP-CTERM sorting domain-containing protein [bacterium]